jgi:hypothetical protein
VRGIRVIAVVAVVWMAAAGTASASGHNITISTGATTNITVGPGTFTANADNAVLNNGDLNTALAAGSVVVDTTTAGGQPGNVTIDDAITWNSPRALTISAAGGILFTSAALTANDPGSSLTLSTGTGNLTAPDGSSPIIVAGPTTMNVPAGQIDLRLSPNDFGQSLSIPAAGSSIDVRDINALSLAGVNASLSAAFSAGGPITQSAPLNIFAATFLLSFDSVTLNHPGNSFGGAVSATPFAIPVTLNAAGNLNLGAMNASDLSASAGAGGPGAITSSGAWLITGSASLTAPTSITANNAGNNFTGPVSTNTPGTATLRDMNALVLGTLSTGADDIVAGGAITQTGVITDLGQFDAQGTSVTLANPANDFDKAQVEATAGALSLRDQNSITLLGANATGASQVVAGLDLVVSANPSFVANSLTLVADEAAGSGLGMGGITIVPNAVLTSSGAPVRLYSARRSQNSIAANATMNGATFTPGPEFVDSAREVWSTRFPNGTATNPFTIFYKEDATPPETTMDSGPAEGSTTNDPTPTFAFSSSEAGSTFACSVDGGAFSACTSPNTVADLTDGPHTFAVRATDAAANTDPTPASRTFSVDATPPETTIDSGPAEGSTIGNRSPTFTFSSSEAGSTFQCTVDGGPLAACNSPDTLASLADGPHTITVDATDALGNADASPAIRTFTVDATAPQTTLTKTPKKKVKTSKKKVKVTFKFASSEQGSTFECSLDGAGFRPCTSPQAHKVGKGKHFFQVRAADAAGNKDDTPARYDFKVKRKKKRHHH